jgi:F0F1-type ATP synthase membrane subunit b/b'
MSFDPIHFQGEGQIFALLQSFQINKTIFIHFGWFLIVFIVVFPVLKSYSQVLARRYEGTSASKEKIDSKLSELEALEESFVKAINQTHAISNESIRKASHQIAKDLESKIKALKESYYLEMENFRIKSDEDTKNLLDETTATVIDLKDKLVGKILN